MTRDTPETTPRPSRPAPQSLLFCLGGRDLEMETIAALVDDALGPDHLVDHRPPWGATADLYARDIRRAVADGLVPVLVELPPGDLPLPEACLFVDHHGDRAGATAPTALEQVFDLLRCPASAWTRHFTLVAANDRGHVEEMRALGATRSEMEAIRAADRRAQGITPWEDESAAQALSQARTTLDGRLLIVHLPHNRSAPVMDRLALRPDDAPRPPEVVALLSPDEANVYGPGAVIKARTDAYPDGWSGGALPRQGFWGRAPAPPPDDLIARVTEALSP